MSQLEPKTEDRRKTLSIIAHASILFSSTILSIGVPLAIILFADDDIAIANAKEAINFCITAYLLAICCVPLIFVVIGFPLFILLAIATIVMPIFAIAKIIKNPDRIYRYRLIWRLL